MESSDIIIVVAFYCWCRIVVFATFSAANATAVSLVQVKP
jgi:hypothetical protein